MLRRSFIALASLALSGASIAAEPAKLPGWMAGAWGESIDGRWAEEFWTSPRGGLMIGAGRNGQGMKLTGWETMRIEQGEDGKIAFIASPQGAPPVRFPLVKAGADEIVFANPAHDYPQRIRYARVGKTLTAEISLKDGSKPTRWVFKAMGE